MAQPRICSLLRMQKPSLDRGFLFASGDTVPSDGADGYQTGCTFQKTNGGVGSSLYVNEGSVASCLFNAIEPLESIVVADLADIGDTDYSAGELLVADGDSFEQVAMSQDATMASDGKVTVVSAHGNFDVGYSGAAGVLDVFPATESKGKLAVSCADQAGDTTVSLVVDEMAAARVVHLPDPGATSYLMQSTAQITLAEADVLDDAVAGTVVASKAVVADANKDVGDFRNLDCVSLDAGSSGAAGSIDVFPSTGAKGKVSIACTDQAGDTTVSIMVDGMAAARTIHLPDPGATSYLMQSTAQITLAEADVLDGATAGTQVAAKAVVANADVNIGVVKATELHVGASGSEIQVTASAAELNVCDGVTAGAVTASKAVVVDASSDIDTIGVTGAVQLKAGAAAAAVTQRFGASATEGLEVKVIDEVVILTNAVETDLTETVPSGAVILSVQANNDTLVVGDASGDNGLVKVGIGITGDPDKYGKSADLTQNAKIDTVPDWAVLGGAETVTVKGCDAAGTAVSELFVAGGEVRVRIVYAVCNSLDDTA